MADQKHFVAVTGGNGYIGSHVVKVLLEHGHKVRVVVHDLSKEEKLKHLKSEHWPNSKSLEFAQADIEKVGDYDKPFEGVDSVIHLATPYRYVAPDPMKDIVEPAVNGTLNALNSALKNKVKRVVVCSSGGAFLTLPAPPGKVFTTADWSPFTVEQNAYFMSKRLAEQAAWDWAKKNPSVEVTVVNPLYVLGPALGENLSNSMSNFKKILLAEQGILNLPMIGVVDVRDVALAHVLAVEKPEAAGQRLFCCNKVISGVDIGATQKKIFPQYNPTFDEKARLTPNFSIDTAPLAKLGLSNYISFEDTVRDGVHSFWEHGVTPKKE